MTVKRLRPKRSRISRVKFNLIVQYFCDDLTAFETSRLVHLNRHTVEDYFNRFRSVVLKDSLEKGKFNGEVEIDESYFGPTRVKGKRGRGAGEKIPVIGLLKRGGKVHVQIVTNCTKEELMPVIRGRILTGSTIYTDGWRSYDHGYRHYRVHHAKNEFARGRSHVNGIESFWSFVKRRLRKFNGVRKNTFLLYLKESEWRFNNRGSLKQSLTHLLRTYS